MTMLIFGRGYLGSRVASKWRDAGDEVVVVTRSEKKAHSLEQDGYRAIVADVTRAETLGDLPAAQAVLFAVGFDRTTGGSIEDVYAGGMRNVLAALPSAVERFIYISTTGVYGKGSGEWVDEDTPTDPQREGGRASLAAEKVLAASPFADRGVVLRLAGIYGPGRVPFLEKLKLGEAIPAVSEGFLNLIHVDDAAAAVVAASQLNRPSTSSRLGSKCGVYCVSDGHPVVRGDYYQEVARLIGAAPPAFVKPNPNSPRAQRAEANRRVKNTRMLAELGVQLRYPNYRAGLAAILGG